MNLFVVTTVHRFSWLAVHVDCRVLINNIEQCLIFYFHRHVGIDVLMRAPVLSWFGVSVLSIDVEQLFVGDLN